jgi:hypothetical protein
MKPINMLGNPAVLITVFCLILISGEHWGGFYLMYILLGLPHGAVHSIIAVAAIALLLFSHYKYKSAFTNIAESMLNIAGVVFLCLSLFFFFYRDRHQYNYPTFNQALPLVILGVFALLALCFMGVNIFRLSNGIRMHKPV